LETKKAGCRDQTGYLQPSQSKRALSKTPGVMITQYTSTLPEGKSTPDFRCKPMPVTVKEGELAVFKAVVTGEPKPEVSWRRAKGPLADKERFQRRYDESTGEHILEVISAVEADTYKCYAVNECGKAVCTTTLNVFDVFAQYYSKAQTPGGENDETFWDVMLNADKRDYESICSEYGVVDLNMILKKLEEKRKKKEKDKQKLKYLAKSSVPLLQDIMNSWDSVPEEQCNQSFGTKSCIKIEGLVQSDTGIYIGDPEEANRHNTQLNHAMSNVDFMIKIQEIKAEENDDALFECVLTHPLPKITWIKKGIVLEDGEKYSITVSDNKLIHRLLIRNCTKLDKGIYSAIAGIISCSAWLVVEDGGTKLIHKTAKAAGAQSDLEKVAKEQQMKIQEEMEKILKAVKGKYSETEKLREDILPHVGHRGESEKTGKTQKANSKDNTLTAMEYSGHETGGLSDIDAIIHESAELTCKLSRDDCEGVWFRDGKKIYPDDNISITMNGSIHKLVIMQCSVEHSGKYRFEADGRKTEAMINIRDPPRFDPEDLSAFTRPLTLKVGHNAIFKLQFIGHKPIKVQWYRDGDELQDDNSVRIEKSASHSRLLLIRCQRRDTGEIKIKIRNDHGFTEAVSQLIVLDKPSAPMGPAEVTESSASCIEFKWRPPKDDGGSPVTNYILERQQVGRNTWKKIGEIPGVPIYRDTDVDRGRKYCYRIWAVTSEGISEVMETDEMQAGRVAFPGPPAPPKVVSAFNECIKLSWSSPAITGGSRLLGYILEKRKQGSNLWTVVNAPDEIIKEKKYAVRDVVEGMAYEFRVCAINLSGAGEFSNASEFVFARDPKIRPRFTNNKMKSFMVVRAGNSVRITVSFEASPRPEITWLKDNVPVTKRATVSNSDGSSQLLIPTSERSDTGIYSVLVKNIVGQETFRMEVRVTDDPKPPGPVELEENVPGTVTVIWKPSLDEKRDDRLHYTVSKLDSTKHTWTTVADRLFNNRFTVCNIVQGREYHFRVYAKNDMGTSAPSESPIWGTEKKKGVFMYPICAVRGNPAPRITWYRSHVNINTDTNYYISNTCGVCSLLILHVSPKDVGEYTVVAENSLGRAECSTVLSIKGKTKTRPLLHWI
uniref:Immunoglobulin like and fibronectin type III domain containing 1, tandem duplicate 2 n=1 Tax=Cyprinodon variegatus TaxID=28743 RepID=A0A3Q2EJK7_CYPVA